MQIRSYRSSALEGIHIRPFRRRYRPSVDRVACISRGSASSTEAASCTVGISRAVGHTKSSSVVGASGARNIADTRARACGADQRVSRSDHMFSEPSTCSIVYRKADSLSAQRVSLEAVCEEIPGVSLWGLKTYIRLLWSVKREKTEGSAIASPSCHMK
jgi:hypothetical protein